MHGISCDRCGETLLLDSSVRYLAKIDVRAAYDPMEITSSDISLDLNAEIARLLEQVQGLSTEQLEDSVHYHAEMDLCPHCQRALLAFLRPPR